MRKQILPLIIFVLSVTGCQKNFPAPELVSLAKATPVLVPSEYFIDGKLANWCEYRNGKLIKRFTRPDTYFSYEYDEQNRITSEFYNDPYQKVLRTKSYYDGSKRLIKIEHFFPEIEKLVTEYLYENDELKYVDQKVYKISNGIPALYSSSRQTLYYLNKRIANIEAVVNTYQNGTIVNTETTTSSYDWHNPNSYTRDGLTTIEFSPKIKAPFYFNDVSFIADEFTDKEIRARVSKFSGPYSFTSKSMLELRLEVRNDITITRENIITNNQNFPLEYNMVVRQADGRISSFHYQYKYIDLNTTY